MLQPDFKHQTRIEVSEFDVLCASVLLDLDATRRRILEAVRGSKGGEFALRASALSAEFKQLCFEAAFSHDEVQSHAALIKSQHKLLELQCLLGAH